MKILVTGANGMLARACISHCLSSGDSVAAYTRQELDISVKESVLSAIGVEKPDAIINCAADTDVDGAEINTGRCYGANAFGVENLALAAKLVSAAFVTVSTDYVFDGAKRGFYTQRDTPNPQSVYGKAKLEGEIRARNAYARSIVVRSGWIFGADGKNFLSVIHEYLRSGKSVRTISDAYGTPTSAADLARRLRELVELDLPCVFHVANTGAGASYTDFAKKICELGGFDAKLLEPISESDLKRPAPRPVSSKLACLFSERLGLAPLADWENALASFLENV